MIYCLYVNIMDSLDSLSRIGYCVVLNLNRLECLIHRTWQTGLFSGLSGELDWESLPVGERATMFLIPTATPASTEDSRSTILDKHCKLDAVGVLSTATTGIKKIQDKDLEMQQKHVIVVTLELELNLNIWEN